MTHHRILLLGANGRTGRRVLEGALHAGHTVTAVVRGHDRLAGLSHERLTVQVGSACDPASLEELTPDHTAVISTLGPRWPTTGAAAVYSQSGEAMAAAVWAGSVPRLLVTSSALLFPATSWTTSLLKRLVWPIVDGASEMEDHIRTCQADWTIVRIGFLNDASDTTRRVLSESLPDDPRPVSRAAVAEFLLEELVAVRHPRAVVGLCG